MKDSQSNVKSPCIRRCCLDEHDVCVGCFRTLNEILAWNEANAQERQDILQCCAQRAKNRPHFS
ncbi:DUF1289 domain-containing protein [Vibrio sp. CAIM 722]|uniref:DUF1289 domain-containing protein n=1 Tax=Vibrio eleionomae TaxID=2653505 RepID=A0A7X4RUA6_9VIBR|nr:DUF1289 domain-containing protein [Vibrio eleionomae]MZI93308.1 DUF1289 domain-containing protein [Vibrio eleionomae]